jgi:hypothetical protein
MFERADYNIVALLPKRKQILLLWSNGAAHFAKHGVDEEMPLSAKGGYTRFVLTKDIDFKKDRCPTKDSHCDSRSKLA